MIINKSKNTVLSSSFSFKNNIGRIKGLMFSKKPKAIIFNTRFGIHTFFLKFPIDLIILNKDNRVIKIKEEVFPNRIVFWNPKYNLVIELPRGSINKSKTKKGDLIEFNL